MFRNRRQKLGNFLNNGEIAIFFSGKPPRSTADSYYKFRENKNFFYLTGIVREDFILVIEKSDEIVNELLFIEEPNYDVEKWVGYKMTKETAKDVSGITDIRYLGEFATYLGQKLYTKVETVYLDLERYRFDDAPTFEEGYAAKLKNKYPHVLIKSSDKFMKKLRVIKSESEVAQIKKAVSITESAFRAVLSQACSEMNEYEIEALIAYEIRKNGGDRNSFDSIVASGGDACILHYVENNKKMKGGDLVLLDFGAQYGCYAGDISRTIPVSGRYSPRQRQLYDIVLKAQKDVMAVMKPGTPFARLNEVCIESLTSSLKGIGLIKEDSEISKYYYHGVSHFLGLDVHDIGSRETELKPGMVLTCEPGLYIKEEGIGIRIEDDILITESGHENLSISIPKLPEEIEGLMTDK